MKHLYVKTTLAQPGAADAVHIAELSPIEGTNMCAMKRLIEMLDGRNITGIWSNNGTSIGMINTPNRHVPHPDSYGAFPDISVCTLNALQFEGLWMEAAAKL